MLVKNRNPHRPGVRKVGALFHELISDTKLLGMKVLEHPAIVGLRDDIGQTLLHHACAKGLPMDALNMLVDQKADINAKDIKGNTPMHLASYNGHYNLTERLIALGGNIKIKNKLRETPLDCVRGVRDVIMLAAEGDYANMEELLETEPDQVKMRDADGWTALHWSSCHGNLNCIALLILKGVDVRVVDKEGKSAMHLAARYGHDNAVKLLLEHSSSEVNRRTKKALWTPLHFACFHNHVTTAATLIDHGADIKLLNSDHRGPLHYLSDEDSKIVLTDLVAKKSMRSALKSKTHSPSALQEADLDIGYSGSFVAAAIAADNATSASKSIRKKEHNEHLDLGKVTLIHRIGNKDKIGYKNSGFGRHTVNPQNDLNSLELADTVRFQSPINFNIPPHTYDTPALDKSRARSQSQTQSHNRSYDHKIGGDSLRLGDDELLEAARQDVMYPTRTAADIPTTSTSALPSSFGTPRSTNVAHPPSTFRPSSTRRTPRTVSTSTADAEMRAEADIGLFMEATSKFNQNQDEADDDKVGQGAEILDELEDQEEDQEVRGRESHDKGDGVRKSGGAIRIRVQRKLEYANWSADPRKSHTASPESTMSTLSDSPVTQSVMKHKSSRSGKNSRARAQIQDLDSSQRIRTPNHAVAEVALPASDTRATCRRNVDTSLPVDNTYVSRSASKVKEGHVSVSPIAGVEYHDADGGPVSYVADFESDEIVLVNKTRDSFVPYSAVLPQQQQQQPQSHPRRSPDRLLSTGGSNNHHYVADLGTSANVDVQHSFRAHSTVRSISGAHDTSRVFAVTAASTPLHLWLVDLQLEEYEAALLSDGFRLIDDFAGLGKEECCAYFRMRTGDLLRLLKHIPKIDDVLIARYEALSAQAHAYEQAQARVNVQEARQHLIL